MDRQSIIIKRKSICCFLSNIKFDKKSFELYRNILSGKINIDLELFICIICQTAFHVQFDGYFEELYIDVCKRRDLYIKQIKLNFKLSYISDEVYINKFKKLFCCMKITNKEIIFNRMIPLLNFDTFIQQFFVERDESNKTIFIDTCNQLLSQYQNSCLNNKVLPIG